ATCWRMMQRKASTPSCRSARRYGAALDNAGPAAFIEGQTNSKSPMRDPYDVLGVQKTDTGSAIRTAYRKLAKKHHPDLNPDKPETAERFKEISAAYGILSDAEKRARYDRGEIDAAGNEVPPQRPFYRDFGDAARSEEHTSELQSLAYLVCRLLL